MNEAAELLARILRQRADLGETELILGPDGVQALRAAAEEAAMTAEPTSAGTLAGSAAATRRPSPPPAAAPRALPVVPVTGPLASLHTEASGCTACGLASTRSTVVFGEGSPTADLMVVGEAPGAEEDRTGRPFVGRAGKLLDTLLTAIGLERPDVFICNVLKCRPPGNRNPQPAEVEACSPFLLRQIEIVAPKVILACGTFSAQTLLETSEPIGRLRGGAHEYRGVPLVATYHPAALLRNSAWLRLAWEDLQLLRRLLDP